MAHISASKFQKRRRVWKNARGAGVGDGGWPRLVWDHDGVGGARPRGDFHVNPILDHVDGGLLEIMVLEFVVEARRHCGVEVQVELEFLDCSKAGI